MNVTKIRNIFAAIFFFLATLVALGVGYSAVSGDISWAKMVPWASAQPLNKSTVFIQGWIADKISPQEIVLTPAQEELATKINKSVFAQNFSKAVGLAYALMQTVETENEQNLLMLKVGKKSMGGLILGFGLCLILPIFGMIWWKNSVKMGINPVQKFLVLVERRPFITAAIISIGWTVIQFLLKGEILKVSEVDLIIKMGIETALVLVVTWLILAFAMNMIQMIAVLCLVAVGGYLNLKGGLNSFTLTELIMEAILLSIASFVLKKN